MATLDPPLNVMRAQVLACTSLERGEIGWIAGASHRQEGAHFPENPPPAGNPPDEVDAIDVPHDPPRGADMHVMTESLRASHAAGWDNRLRLIIFDGRQCSSYDHAEGKRWTWRPYYGENKHRKHAHIERTDANRTNLKPFEIGIDGMDTRQNNHLVALAYRTLAIFEDTPTTRPYRLVGETEDRVEENKFHKAWRERLDLLESNVLAAIRETGGELGETEMAELGELIAAAVAEPVTAGVLEGLGTLQFTATRPDPSH